MPNYRFGINSITLFLLVVAGTAGVCAAEQIYKWVDKQGQVHYAGQVPPGEPAEKVDLPPEPPPEVQQQARERLHSTLEANQAQQAAQRRELEAKVQEQASAEAQAGYCKQLQQRLTTLTSLPMARIGVRGDDGQVRRVNEQEWQKNIQKTRDARAKYCK